MGYLRILHTLYHPQCLWKKSFSKSDTCRRESRNSKKRFRQGNSGSEDYLKEEKTKSNLEKILANNNSKDPS